MIRSLLSGDPPRGRLMAAYGLVVVGLAETAVSLSADAEPALLLFLDYSAVDHGPPPHPIPSGGRG